MDWDDVRHFLALARLGSVRAAGASLGVSHSTVSRRVEALEARLAARLFDRARDGFTLTEAGRRMLPGAERVECELVGLERDLAGQDERLAGPVTLTCCDAYVSDLLLHNLSSFCAAHPEIELSMTTDSRPFDLDRREADIAIRTLAVGAQPPGSLIGRRLAPVMIASYAARAHRDMVDPVLSGSHARWLSFEPRKLHREMVASCSYPALPLWGAFNSLELMVQAARQGLGLVMLPTYVGDAESALVRLEPPDLRHVADLWLLSHPDLRRNTRLRAARTQIAAGLQGHAALFAGDHGAPAQPAVPKSHRRDGDCPA